MALRSFVLFCFDVAVERVMSGSPKWSAAAAGAPKVKSAKCAKTNMSIVRLKP
jgi:hypothetical protein